MRLSKACLECRTIKKKCKYSDTPSAVGCLTCQERRIPCSRSISVHSARGTVPLLARDPETDPNTIRPSQEDISDFVKLYLQFIHERPHSLFHEQTLWNEVQSGTIDECLLWAICALGCRFSDKPNRHTLAVTYKSRASAAFAKHLEQMSLPHIQTCILLANLCAAEQANGLEALYFGIANRMAYVLRLHQKRNTDALVLQEMKCRVLWSLYMADKWCPPGLNLPRELVNPGPQLELPMEELAFQSMDITEKAEIPVRDYGLWKQMILLADMLGFIQDLNRSLVHETCDQTTMNAQVTHLARCLQEWSESLPGHMTMQDHNLEAYRHRGMGGTFVALHLGYHHYATLLYFQFLDSTQPASARTAVFAERCRSHALAYSRLLRSARGKDNCHVVYLTVAQMTMVSSSVLLHMLLFAGHEERELARTELISNFEALLELKSYWPRMDMITQRLHTFQRACMKSTKTTTHTIDKWMIRFLLEYGLPFEEEDQFNARSALTGAATPDLQAPLEQKTTLGWAFQELCS